jgi:hypothetical protein
LFELIYLHRQNPVVKPFFDWREGGSFWVDTASANDLPALRDMISAQEGPESLAAFEYWRQHPAVQIWVWRDALKKANAFVLKIDIQELKPADITGDPVVQRLATYQQKHLNLRPGELVCAFRLWMAKDTHQQVSPLQSSMFLTIVQYYFTPGLAVSMLAVVQPGFWKAVLSYADLTHVAELDFAVHEIPFGWYLHDWRVRPPLAWLDLLGRREVDASAGADEADHKAQAVVLNETAFGEAVGEALRHFHNNNTLINNPLLRSKLIIQATAGDPSDAQRVGVLKQAIQDVLKEIEDSPIDGKYHRVLYRSFINPVGSQEKTADFLNMSFSTYRRYLQAGVMRLAELLWNKEFS